MDKATVAKLGRWVRTAPANERALIENVLRTHERFEREDLVYWRARKKPERWKEHRRSLGILASMRRTLSAKTEAERRQAEALERKRQEEASRQRMRELAKGFAAELFSGSVGERLRRIFELAIEAETETQ